MKFCKTAAATLCVVTLFGCAASGPKLSDLQNNGGISTLSANLGRVYFYRKASFVGAALRPNIKLDGVVVGDSIPGGFFFVDTAPGSHLVSATTEVERTTTFTLVAGETKYVQTSTSIGVLVGHVNPEVADPVEAQRALADLSFTGPAASPIASTRAGTQPSSTVIDRASSPVQPPSSADATDRRPGFKTYTQEFGSGEPKYTATPTPTSQPARSTPAQAGGPTAVARADAQDSRPQAVQVRFQGAADEYLNHMTCSSHSRTELKVVGSDFEIYSAPCDMLDHVLIKCEATGCHVMQ